MQAGKTKAFREISLKRLVLRWNVSYPLQLTLAIPCHPTLAIPCHPTLAKRVWASCSTARERTVMDMASRMMPSTLNGVIVVVFKGDSPRLFFLHPVVSVFQPTGF